MPGDKYVNSTRRMDGVAGSIDKDVFKPALPGQLSTYFYGCQGKSRRLTGTSRRGMATWSPTNSRAPISGADPEMVGAPELSFQSHTESPGRREIARDKRKVLV